MIGTSCDSRRSVRLKCWGIRCMILGVVLGIMVYEDDMYVRGAKLYIG